MINARTNIQNIPTTTFKTLKASHKIIRPAKKAKIGFLSRSFMFHCFCLQRIHVENQGAPANLKQAKNSCKTRANPKFVGDKACFSDKVK